MIFIKYYFSLKLLLSSFCFPTSSIIFCTSFKFVYARACVCVRACMCVRALVCVCARVYVRESFLSIKFHVFSNKCVNFYLCTLTIPKVIDHSYVTGLLSHPVYMHHSLILIEKFTYYFLFAHLTTAMKF